MWQGFFLWILCVLPSGCFMNHSRRLLDGPPPTKCISKVHRQKYPTRYLPRAWYACLDAIL